MADQLKLTDVTQTQYDAAEAILIDLVRSAYPTLDMRRGTVIRDTLIRPAASLTALNVAQVDQVRRVTSLVTILQDNTATIENVDAILANFNMQQIAGSTAAGLVRVKVDAVRTYTLAPGFTFATLDGLQYTVGSVIVAKQNATNSLNEVSLLSASDGSYYFVVPVTASATGAGYNIPQGTALDASTTLYGFVSASAYVNFSSGSDTEAIQSAISRIPSALSHRALTNRTAIEAQLRARFDGTAVTIQAISVQGYGDAAQRRDKYNVFGVAIGGRADIYARTFNEPSIVVLEKTGIRIAAGTYQFTVTADDAPGFYAVRSITDVDGLALSSYAFTDTRVPSGVEDIWHDFDIVNNPADTSYSVYQASTVTVTGVPSSAATHVFKAELYGAPGIGDLQAYVDDPAVRNVAADFVVRCPLICLVSCVANVYYPLNKPLDLANAAQQLVAYINSRSFVDRLTRSELTNILIAAGASRVDLGAYGMKLEGRIRDSAGTWHTLTGDALDIAGISAPATLLVPSTSVFAAELQSIQLTGIAE